MSEKSEKLSRTYVHDEEIYGDDDFGDSLKSADKAVVFSKNDNTRIVSLRSSEQNFLPNDVPEERAIWTIYCKMLEFTEEHLVPELLDRCNYYDFYLFMRERLVSKRA